MQNYCVEIICLHVVCLLQQNESNDDLRTSCVKVNFLSAVQGGNILFDNVLYKPFFQEKSRV